MIEFMYDIELVKFYAFDENKQLIMDEYDNTKPLDLNTKPLFVTFQKSSNSKRTSWSPYKHHRQ